MSQHSADKDTADPLADQRKGPRMIRPTHRRTLYLAAAAVTGAAAVLAVAALPGGGPATSRAVAAPPQAALTSGFQDHTNSDYLRIQLDPSQPDYGQFIVAIPGTGLLWSDTTATVAVHAPTSSTLTYNAGGELDADAVLDREFGVAYQPQGPVTHVDLRLQGQVDPQRGTGAIEVWVNGTHYAMTAAAPAQDAAAAAATIVHAIAAGDWSALYTLADTSLKNGMTQDQFTAQVQQQFSGSDKIVDMHQTGTITYRTVSSGVLYAYAPVSVTANHAGQTQTASAQVVLIQDGGQWRWFTVK